MTIIGIAGIINGDTLQRINFTNIAQGFEAWNEAYM
jgi:hypothetical protein